VPDARFFLTHRLSLALAAKARGFDVHVATPKGDSVERIKAAGLSWHRVRFGALRRKPWSDLLSLAGLMFLYRRLRPDLVHHVTFKAILYGTLAARLNGVPSVVNAMTGLGDVFAAESSSDRVWRWITVTLFRTLVRHSRMRVIVQNSDDGRALAGAGAVRAHDLVLIRGSGVDPAHWTPGPARNAVVPVVVCASRIVVTKGINEFVAAARLLRASGIAARFVIAGDFDPDSGSAIAEPALRAWIEEGVIEYAGMLDDVRELYAASDIACLPSWREGLPKGLIEAASCALPIVTTDVPGCREIVRDGVNGILVPVRSVEPLAAALRRLIEDPALRRRMGARGREIVAAEFSLRQVIDATLAVYEGLENERK
jgi:glycosyltransferase involved in cell wall biosynthesis